METDHSFKMQSNWDSTWQKTEVKQKCLSVCLFILKEEIKNIIYVVRKNPGESIHGKREELLEQKG